MCTAGDTLGPLKKMALMTVLMALEADKALLYVVLFDRHNKVVMSTPHIPQMWTLSPV